MLKLHFAILWSGRVRIAAALFCMLLLGVAMSFAGWLDSPAEIQNAGWICLLVFVFAMAQIEIAGAGRRAGIFIAQKQFEQYLYGEFCAVLVLSCGFAALWSLGAALVTGLWLQNLWLFLTKSLFCAIAVHAMIVNLEPYTVALRPSQRHLLSLVIAGPWVLPAWLVGLVAGDDIVSQQPCLIPVLALVVLGLVQFAMGALFRMQNTGGRQQKT